MVDRLRATAGLAVVTPIILAAMLVLLTARAPVTSSPVLIDDEPLLVEALHGPGAQVAHGTWLGAPVVILKLPEPVHGPAVAMPQQAGYSIVIFEAKSTYLGCGIEAYTHDALGLVLRDICHHGLWDPANQGAPLRQPAPQPLHQLKPSLSPVDAGSLAIRASA